MLDDMDRQNAIDEMVADAIADFGDDSPLREVDVYEATIVSYMNITPHGVARVTRSGVV